MKKPFTLIEILVSMSILTVFLLGLMQFYSSTETILNSGIERSEMFERARIAMEMMANDLACVYYSQSGKMKTVDISKETLKVSTIRPEKMTSSSKTCVVGVCYAWDDSGKKLVYSFDKKGDNFDITRPFSEKCEAVLVEGVNDFEVRSYAEGNNLPALVVIRMELVDAKTMRRYKANPTKEILDNAPKREFRRMIIIDRGQPKPDALDKIFVKGS